MSWLDYIGNALSKIIDDYCYREPYVDEDVSEKVWENREEIGEAVEIAKDIIDWIPDDTFDH
ncbi:hypothetical protein [Succinimonas sp.]|uniref:hypothetical protein n=1 Tax=Succinimonas sp. TaxID=1936151 RepID=UPI00386C2A0F